MTYEDKTITCADCGTEFLHSADDQQRYAERGLEHEPKRCRPCRAKRKSGGGGGGGSRAPREFHTATCAECGKETEVPFKPTEGRPVYCRDCFKTHRTD